MVSVAVSLARTAGGRLSSQALPPKAQPFGAVSGRGPTASWTTPSVVIKLWSARLADFTGHAAIAVTATITRIAQPAVVVAAPMSAWRERQRRYRPTIASVMTPNTLKTFS